MTKPTSYRADYYYKKPGMGGRGTRTQISGPVSLNRPGFTGGQNSRRIARYGTDIKEENREAVFT